MSQMPRLQRGNRAAILLSAGVFFAALLAATSVTAPMAGTTQAAGVAYAKAQIAKYSKTSKLVPAGKPFDATKLQGKTVWYVPSISTVDGIRLLARNLKAALTAAGVKYFECDGKGNALGWNTCMRQAVAQKPDAIVMESITPEAVGASIRAARKAGIQVHVNNITDAATWPWYKDASAQTAFGYAQGARLVADWVIADSNGTANVLVIDVADLSLRKYILAAYRDEFKRHCPKCVVRYAAVPSIAEWPKLQPLTYAELLRNPDVNYVVSVYDSEAHYIIPAVNQAGRSDTVKVAGYNASVEQMQQLKKSQGIFADVGSDHTSVAWAEADQVLRLLAGLPPVRVQASRTRVFTESNINSIDVSIKGFYSGRWYGPTDFKAKYLKLWGLK